MNSVHGTLERYLARTATLATAAMDKFQNASSTDSANHRPRRQQEYCYVIEKIGAPVRMKLRTPTPLN
ncbi:hypothetical protein ABFY71_13210 [Devosia sp. RY10]